MTENLNAASLDALIAEAEEASEVALESMRKTTSPNTSSVEAVVYELRALRLTVAVLASTLAKR